LAGQVSLDEALEAARAGGRLSAGGLAALEQAMREFAATLRRWRRTHARLAVRMLGEQTGTGYTEGSPYLQAVQSIPVFASLAGGDDTGDAEAVELSPGIAPGRRPDVTGAPGRCPFAH
jgi:hypothetical protein